MHGLLSLFHSLSVNFFNVPRLDFILVQYSVIVAWIEVTVFPVGYVMSNQCCTLRIPCMTVVSFPDDFSEKYVWWSAYSILVLVRRNVGALFYFNLTRDVTQTRRITFRNSSMREPAVKKNLDVDQAIRAACLSFPLRSHRKGEESLLRYPFLCSN